MACIIYFSNVSLPEKYTNYNTIRSASYAFNGIRLAFLREYNLGLQFIIGLVAAGISLYFGLWLFAFLNLVMMGVIISLEMVNTAFEALCDLVNLEFDHRIKTIKDIAAASVLISALVWLTLIVFESVVILLQLGIVK
jgi:diacylglycerol kinase